MAVGYNPKVVADSLVLSLDASSPKNYNVGVSTNWVDKVGGNNGTLYGGTHHNDGPFVGAGYVEFDGTGQALSVPAGSDFAYGTGDFTIEGWFYPTVIGQVSGASAPSHILFGQTVSGTNYLLFAIDTNGKLLYYRTSSGGGSDQFSSAPNGSVVLNQWQHIALCRSSGTTKAFVDGQEIISISDTFDFNNTDRNPTIGNYTHTFTTQPFNGYVSNFRILKGTGLYTSNFTVPTKSLTATTNTSLLTCQGNTITDASSSAHTITASGNIPLTKEPFTGAGAVEFDGTNDYLTIADSEDLEFGSGDFTIEAYIYPTGIPQGFYGCIFAKGLPLQCYFMNTNSLSLFVDNANNGSPYSIIDNNNITGNNTVNQDEWTHIAICRSGDTWKVFTGGVQRYSATHSGTIFNNTDVFSIGDYGPSAGTYEFQGLISNFRVIKGTALYTSAFTPPSRTLEPIENTTLLTCQGQNIKDYSSSAHAITVNGDAKATIASSAFEFDGSNYDYILSQANPTLNWGTGDFTVELWANVSSSTSFGTLFATEVNAQEQQNNTFTIAMNSSRRLGVIAYSTYSISNSAATQIPKNTWTHIVVTRQGTTLTLYIDKSSAATGTSSINYVAGGYAIGTLPRSPSNTNFTGKVSNVRVYKGKALTLAEIEQNYNATKGRFE